MENTTGSRDNFDWPYRKTFFTFNITIGCLFVILHAQLISVILQTRSLRNMAGYRFMTHICVVDLINSVNQIVAQACTFNEAHTDPTLNMINGAIFQGTWAADYPMILIVAVNRLTAVILPFKVKSFFGEEFVKIYIIACLVFGVANTAMCLSGEVTCLWFAEIPSFAFSTNTVYADVIQFVDFWFAELVVVSSSGCYIIILVYLLGKRKLIMSSKHELPLLFHSCCIFGMTGISLYLWHYPAGDSVLFHQLLQTGIVVRFGMPPVAALLVNRTIRGRFFRLLQSRYTDFSTVARLANANRSGILRISALYASTNLFSHNERRGTVNVK